MRVIVASERKMCELPLFTKSSIEEALVPFFYDGIQLSFDPDGEAPISYVELIETFRKDHRVVFYNDEGDRTFIRRDLSV